MGAVNLDAFRELLTPRGQEALGAAAEAIGDDPVAAVTRLRKIYDADLTSAALVQAELRLRAREKFGADADLMYFTRPGLEQATRREVADHRARRVPEGSRVADVVCGIGGDLLALARAGCVVEAVDADPLTAAIAAANAETAGGWPSCSPWSAATRRRLDVTRVDAVFCRTRRVVRPAPVGGSSNPKAQLAPMGLRHLGLARSGGALDRGEGGPGPAPRAHPAGRRGGVGQRGRRPGRGRPLVRRAGRTPAPRDPADRCKEGPPVDASGRAGVACRQLTGSGEVEAAVGPVRRYLYDPDPAVVRAHLLAELAVELDGTLADPSIAYLYADAPVATPFARCLEITDVLPFSLKRLRALLRERRVGRVEILKRGSALDPERLRRDLRLAGEAAASLVLTRVAGAPPAPAGAGLTDRCSPLRRMGEPWGHRHSATALLAREIRAAPTRTTSPRTRRTTARWWRRPSGWLRSGCSSRWSPRSTAG